VRRSECCGLRERHAERDQEREPMGAGTAVSRLYGRYGVVNVLGDVGDGAERGVGSQVAV